MPVVNSFDNTANTVISTEDTGVTVVTGSNVNFTFDTNILSYYNCIETMYKLKNGIAPLVIDLGPLTFGNASYGGDETTVSNLLTLGECSLYKSQPDQKANPFVSLTPTQAFSQVLLDINIRGVQHNLDLTSYLSSMTYLGDFAYSGTNRKEYGVAVPNILETGLGIYMVYQDGYGYYEYYLSSFNPPLWVYWTAQKKIKLYLYSTATSHGTTVDTGLLETSILDWDMTIQVNQDPSAGGTYLGSGIAPDYVYTTSSVLTVDNTL